MMSEPAIEGTVGLCAKIARLVEECGWSMEEFARQADLNRLTVRSIFQGGQRRLHHATVRACAEALGLNVHDLRVLPLDQLLPLVRRRSTPGPPSLRSLYEHATQPELVAWAERNPERAARLTTDELNELLSLQGTGGPLTAFGVAHFVDLIERKRHLLEQVAVIAGTEYIDLLESLVGLVYDRIQPYRDKMATQSE
jgi:transcriptional regulator with XRE-family HTH domain